MRWHDKEKRQKCDFCFYTYYKSTDYERHLKMHIAKAEQKSQNPQCWFRCGTAFPRNDNIWPHFNEKHGMTEAAARRFVKTNYPSRSAEVTPDELKCAIAPDEHIYSRLDPSKSEIRLITVTYSSTYNAIRCTLNSYPLDNSPPYQALSYVWGDMTHSNQIWLDNKLVWVTINLYNALLSLSKRPLSKHSLPTKLWVDAVCINRQDIDEKNSQVRMISKIYRKASTVYVWLEDEKSDSFSSHYRKLPLSADSPAIKSLDASSDGKPFLDLYPKLLSSSWSKRVWTIQESIMSENITFHWNGGCVSFDSWQTISCKTLQYLEDALKGDTFEPNSPIDLSGPGNASNMLGPEINNLTALISRLEFTDPSDTLTDKDQVQALLSLLSVQETTDPRDKVYAILSLLPADLRDRIGVDYNRSVSAVYTDFATTLLQKGIADLLAFAGSDLNRFGLPSWVPDWTAKRRVCSAASLFSAGTATATEVKISIQGDCLHVKGVAFDTVSGVYRHYRPTGRRLQRMWTTFSHQVRHHLEEPTTKPSFISRLILRYVEKWYELTVSRLDGQLHPLPFLYMENQVPFVSSDERLGVGPSSTESGDLVAVLFGATVPFVLRPNNDTTYRLIGHCYMEGTMEGQALRRGRQVETFCIV
jgi:hypothetical protein